MNVITRESSSLTRVIEIEGITVVRMDGELFSDVNHDVTKSVVVTNYDLYLENLEECRLEIAKFHADLNDIEDNMIEKYHVVEVEEPVEDPEELPEV